MSPFVNRRFPKFLTFCPLLSWLFTAWTTFRANTWVFWQVTQVNIPSHPLSNGELSCVEEFLLTHTESSQDDLWIRDLEQRMESVIWKPTRYAEREGQIQLLFILVVITLLSASQLFPSCRLPNIKDASIFFLMNKYKSLLTKCL